MVLLRRVIGDALRARRQSQHRTLREVSTAANVSLGYLSEIERGQKEASSELLAAICGALGARLSEVLREVSHTVANAERTVGPGVDTVSLDGIGLDAVPADAAPADGALVTAGAPAAGRRDAGAGATDGGSAGDRAAAGGTRGPRAEVGRAEVADSLVRDGRSTGVRIPTGAAATRPRTGEPAAGSGPARAATKAGVARARLSTMVDGDVAVTVRQDGPLKATLQARRTRGGRGRDILTAA